MKTCIVCGASLSKEPLMICENMPAGAQSFLDQKDTPLNDRVTLALHQCTGCGLVQFDCEPVSYYKNVIRAGVGSTIAALRREQYQHFIETYHLKDKKIVEIGCGQGEFLRILEEFPVSAFGIEHDPELVRLARAKGLQVEQGFAENDTVQLKDAPFDAFLSFNFLEHQVDPNGMMRCIYENLKEEGYGLITVPSFQYILDNCSFYELLRDHIANYTEDSLRFLVEKNGFCVLETSIVNRDTIMMIVQKRPPVNVSKLRNNFEILKKQFSEFFQKRAEKGIAVWGAGHQGLTAISTMEIQGQIQYIIDSASFKQGKYAPASRLPIVSPDHFFEDPVDTILIIAPGYTDEIAASIRQKYGNSIEIAALRSESIEIIP